MAQTKAVHLKSLKKFLLLQSSPATWDRVLAQIGPADRALVAQPVFPSEWLDYAVWWRLLCTVDRVAGRGDGSLIRTIGAFDARENLGTVYRVFLPFLSAKSVVARCQLMWRQYYDVGILRATLLGDRDWEVRLTDFPGLPPGHEMEVLGWIEEALKLAGFSGVQVTHPGPCLARGDDHCSFMVHMDQPA